MRKSRAVTHVLSRGVTCCHVVSQDLLAYASMVGWKYKLHRKIPIEGAFRVEDLPDPVFTFANQSAWA